MLFNSFEFLIFLTVVFFCYWNVFKSRKYQNYFLVVASAIFYGWWNPIFLFLIGLNVAVSFVSGLLIDRFRGEGSLSKYVLWGDVAFNLGLLCVFKYFNFFSESVVSLFRIFGWAVDAVTLDIVLPVGISFYTFQALSYCIDVYRGVIRPARDFAAFMVFISFFPQLVAGPIERASDLLPQFMRRRRFDYAFALSGMKLILWGLFKKMIVADNAAATVDYIFGDYDNVGFLNLWLGAMLFAFQIYGDFSGYSDIAVGVARLFGIRLRRNFNLPYFATSIHDFWKKWHISLTSWLRDYIYIPLGGSRNGVGRTIRNTALVFLASGLWHGANFTFVAWGAYHAALYIPHVLGKKYGLRIRRPVVGSPYMPMLFTFMLVIVGWVFFRAVSISEAINYIGLMFTIPTGNSLIYTSISISTIAWCIIMVILEWFSRGQETPFAFSTGRLWKYTSVRWIVYVVFFIGTLVFAGRSQQFIYFQF